MTRPRPHLASRSIAIACIAWATLAAGIVAADELDAYRALASSPRHEALLAFTRAALHEYFENDGAAGAAATPAAPDSLVPDWPGPPTGLFLSLTRGASTRACVGTATPAARHARAPSPQARRSGADVGPAASAGARATNWTRCA